MLCSKFAYLEEAKRSENNTKIKGLKVPLETKEKNMGQENLLQLSSKGGRVTSADKRKVHKEEKSNVNTSDNDSNRYDKFERKTISFAKEQEQRRNR